MSNGAPYSHPAEEKLFFARIASPGMTKGTLHESRFALTGTIFWFKTLGCVLIMA